MLPPSVKARGAVRTLLENRQENVVLQKWDISCGAAALGTILNYQFGDKVGEQEIAKGLMQRDEYRKNPNIVKSRLGFSLLDLQRYVDKKGYRGIGLGKLELDHIKDRAPMIISVFIHGYNHFVVFRGMRGNRVLLADPAWGNRTMGLERFMDIWTDYPKMGRVGFQVIDPSNSNSSENLLEPQARDFVMLE